MVAKITAPMSEGEIPDFLIASFDASTAMSKSDCSLSARALVTIPVRCLIHSSEESIGPATSSFVTVRWPLEAPSA